MCVDTYKQGWGIEYHQHDICRSLEINFNAVVHQLKVKGADEIDILKCQGFARPWIRQYMQKAEEEMETKTLVQINMTQYWEAIKRKLYETCNIPYKEVSMTTERIRY